MCITLSAAGGRHLELSRNLSYGSDMSEFLANVLVGLLGGIASGLLGVSPGGILVPVTVLILGLEQHVAQSLSLLAQIPPTSLAGIRRYWSRGTHTPVRWLIPLTAGFLLGGVLGAIAAGHLSRVVLQWIFVGYLLLLDVLLISRARRASAVGDSSQSERTAVNPVALLLLGLVAGTSSGLMGIGGGLATTVGLSAVLKRPQHQAQAVSLAMAMIPLTIPSALVYWRQGWSPPWTVILGVIVGLWAGTDFGARIANRTSESSLRGTLIVLVAAMAIYMTYKALA
jgi:uncharacterized membrane protein YfcA